MINGFDVEAARDALTFLDPGCDRETWHTIGRAAIAAGISIDELDEWSAPAANYAGTKDVQTAFRTIKREGGTGPGTLIRLAKDAGWVRSPGGRRGTAMKSKPAAAPKPRPGMGPAEVWERSEGATDSHPYIVRKQGLAEGLRVLPAGDPLRIAGESMAGALMVPVKRPDGTISSLQFIALPDVAARLKAENKSGKLNLPGAQLENGSFTVGEMKPGGVAYIVEGIGTAWACWKATGCAAVVCFGWGRVRTVVAELREREAAARLVLVPDVGKESSTIEIARDVGATVAAMPNGWPQNSDVNDLAQRDGFDALEALLLGAREAPAPEPRFKLLNSTDLRALPPLAWRIRGVLPASGLAGLYGPSASGKSFLGFDMAAAIAEGRRWFDARVETAPVVYAALEGEAGFKLRAQAWEAHKGRALPADLHIVLQAFKLTAPQDVQELATVVPAGSVVFIDTLNRAAPTADENSSKDMGEILEAAKRLQGLTGGLVVLIHHTGKDATKGLRGHSSLFAAMDAAVEVSRDGDRREWKVAKSKDGQDGDAHAFKLQIETLAVDEHGDAVTSCVVVPDTETQDVQRVKLPQGGNQRLVLEALRPMFKTGETGKAGAPPLRPCIELEAAIAAGAAKLSCPTDKRNSRARDAITGLASRGVVGLHEGWLWLA